jgi:hypothetical protein
MQVFQTAGVPPSFGKIIWAIMGWMRKREKALTNSVTANRSGTDHLSAAASKKKRGRSIVRGSAQRRQRRASTNTGE